MLIFYYFYFNYGVKMIEKTSVILKQSRLTIPKSIREHLELKVGLIVKWTLDESDGTVKLRFINV